MGRVVAVLDVGARELAEAHGDFHFARRVRTCADLPHVLARPALPDRGQLAVARQRDGLFEVHVHRVVPAATADELPDLEFAELRGNRHEVVVGEQAVATVGLDGPRVDVRAPRAAEHELVVLRRSELGIRRTGERDHLLPAFRVQRGIHGEVGAAVGVHAELHDLADARVATGPAVRNTVEVVVDGLGRVAAVHHRGQRDRLVGLLAGGVLEQVDHVDALARLELGEVDHDVPALGDRLHRQHATIRALGAVEGHRVLHDVAVVGDEVEHDRLAVLAHQPKLVVARDAAVEDAEAVAAGAHVHVRRVLPVDRHDVAEEAVRLELVEPQLAVGVPGLVRDDEVDVVVAVAPVEGRAARQAQVHAVVDRLVAAIDGAVDVHQRRVALVDVLRREIEHVVVEPQRARRLAPVAAHARDAAVAVRATRARIRGVDVDRVVAREDHRPAEVVVLAREEVGVHVAIALGRVVAVVHVRRDRVRSEAHVGGGVHRQRVVVAEQQALADARLQQLGRERAVERPQRARILRREVRVDLRRDARRGAFEARQAERVVVQAARRELARGVAVALERVAHARVHARAGLSALEEHLRRELLIALVRPALARRATVGRHERRGATEQLLDQRLVGVLRERVALARRGRSREGRERRVDRCRRGAAGNAGCALDLERRTFRQLARGRDRTRAELFREQQLLREGLGAEARARTTTRRDGLCRGN